MDIGRDDYICPLRSTGDSDAFCTETCMLFKMTFAGEPKVGVCAIWAIERNLNRIVNEIHNTNQTRLWHFLRDRLQWGIGKNDDE